MHADSADVFALRREPPKTSLADVMAELTGGEGDNDSCGAFRYLRGLRDQTPTLEFVFRNGNTETFPYSLLASVRFNPSVGLLLKFSGGDILTLVLIRGSNLDAVLPDRAVNLTDRGINRHRIVAVFEMDEEQIRKAGDKLPTIDRIEVGEFESLEEQRQWLAKVAPALTRAE